MAAPKLPALVIHEFEQNGPDWIAARLGLATASEFSTIMASGEDGGDSRGRLTLMRKLAGEIITGDPMANYSNHHIQRGKSMEPEIRDWYARTRFVEVRQVGFVYNPEIAAGWSPDGLVGDDGSIEIKSADHHVMIEILERGTFPTAHRAQCHGGLLVGRREWIDLIVYSHPKLPKYVTRLTPDPVYAKKIAIAIEVFNYDLQKMVKKIRAMGIG